MVAYRLSTSRQASRSPRACPRHRVRSIVEWQSYGYRWTRRSTQGVGYPDVEGRQRVEDAYARQDARLFAKRSARRRLGQPRQRAFACALSRWGATVADRCAQIYQDPTRSTSGYPGPYMTNAFPGRAVHDLAFCPYDDILGTGHATGLTHLLVPGAGEANYDAYEADPYEGRRARREREVALLMDKIPADQITMDRDLIGKLARPDEARVHPDPKTLRGQGAGREVPFARKKRFERLHIEGKAEEDSGSDVEEGEEDVGQEGVDEERRKERKRRVKGANKVAKRVRRKRANVETEETTARREKAARMKIERKEAALDAAAGLGAGGALNRFSRPLKRA